MKDWPNNLSALDLISTEDILEELSERFDHFVWGGMRSCDVKGDEPEEEWFGDEVMCQVLCMRVLNKINTDSQAMSEIEEGDEDDEDD